MAMSVYKEEDYIRIEKELDVLKGILYIITKIISFLK